MTSGGKDGQSVYDLTVQYALRRHSRHNTLSISCPLRKKCACVFIATLFLHLDSSVRESCQNVPGKELSLGVFFLLPNSCAVNFDDYTTIAPGVAVTFPRHNGVPGHCAVNRLVESVSNLSL